MNRSRSAAVEIISPAAQSSEGFIRVASCQGVELALEFLLGGYFASSSPHVGFVAASGVAASMAGPLSHTRPGPRSAGAEPEV